MQSKDKDKISKYFTWKEALFLPKWNRLGAEEDGLNDTIKENLTNTFNKLDIIREYLDSPIIVHCAWRPKDYNKLVNGAPFSGHVTGQAIDFHPTKMTCQKAIDTIKDKLEEWGIRMEDNGIDPTWVHIDVKPVITKRFFRA